MLVGELWELELKLEYMERRVREGQDRKMEMNAREAKRFSLAEAEHARLVAAYSKCLADVQERGLTPRPKYWKEQDTFKRMRAARHDVRTHITPAMQEYLDSLPADATRVRDLVQSEINKYVKEQEASLEQSKRSIRYVAEIGKPIPSYETEYCLKD
jgi:type II secretory pathway component PulJ